MGPRWISELSLLHGAIPPAVQVVAAVVFVAAVARRRLRRCLRGAAALMVGAALAVGVHFYLDRTGLGGNPAPVTWWLWVTLSGAAVAVVLLGRRDPSRWRRVTAAAAVPLCVLGAAVALNQWTGYLPSVGAAWSQLTAGPLPDESSDADVVALAAHHDVPLAGKVVPVATGDAGSGFGHRGELVYLPPAWFASSPPPPLPAVMMLGGELNTPADWVRLGDAVATADDFASHHHGRAPILVFADAGGTFNNDTECVNGPRGRAADHLVRDVVPAVEATFGASRDPARWGVAGWSMGGTCAVDLALMHPLTFHAFVDIAGDAGPNSGDHDQTVARLYGGDSAAWADFDPLTVMTRHGRYADTVGWFAVNGDVLGRRGDQLDAARFLCGHARALGVACAVQVSPGRHDWPFAARAFAGALPWLADALAAPGRSTPAVTARLVSGRSR